MLNHAIFSEHELFTHKSCNIDKELNLQHLFVKGQKELDLDTQYKKDVMKF